MRKNLASAAVLAFAAAFSCLLSTAALAGPPPSDAQATSNGPVATIRFHDGSTFAKTPAATTVKGPQAIAWFLSDTDDAALKTLDPKDVVSLSITPAAETYSFADGSAMTFAGAAFSVGEGMAAKYHALMTEANRKVRRQP